MIKINVSCVVILVVGGCVRHHVVVCHGIGWTECHSMFCRFIQNGGRPVIVACVGTRQTGDRSY